MQVRNIRLRDNFLSFFLYPLIYLFGPYCKTTQILIDGKKYNSYIADNFFSRAFGYMFRNPDDIKKDEAMLFVFNSPHTVTFTMSNVNFPIKIFALDKNYRVLDEALMKPGQKQNTKLTGTLFLEVPIV